MLAQVVSCCIYGRPKTQERQLIKGNKHIWADLNLHLQLPNSSILDVAVLLGFVGFCLLSLCFVPLNNVSPQSLQSFIWSVLCL